MNFWTVKCRLVPQHGERGWHWDSYFFGSDDDTGRGFHFGGAEWIRSPESIKYIRDDVDRGDLVLCYQYEQRRICGLTRMNSAGLKDRYGKHTAFWLDPVEKALSFPPDVTIAAIRRYGADARCFGPGTQGTVFPISEDEFAELVDAISDLVPEQSRRLAQWLRISGFRRPRRPRRKLATKRRP